MVKAYIVEARDHDVACALVWAKDVNIAKSIASKTAWLCDIALGHLVCYREKSADDMRPDGYCACDELIIEDRRLMRELEWREVDNEGIECRICGLSKWDSIVESHLNEDEVCGNCQKTNRQL